MDSFGWFAGIHYSPHISNADFAAFSCLLVMPWASSTDHYDPSAVPEIPQLDCESGFGEWLTPWLRSTIEWQLMTRDDNGDWATIGTPRRIVPKLDASRTGLLRNRAKERLDQHVSEHTSAMGFAEGGPSGKSYTYPIMSPGLSQLPAPISDSLLGTTAVRVAKRGEIAGRLVAAVPVFCVDGQKVAPTGKAVQIGAGSPPQFEFAYDGPVKSVRAVDYKFSGCIVECVVHAEHEKELPPIPPAPVLVRSRAPDRQLYAEVSRRFWPMKLWLDSTDLGKGDARGFCRTFVRLLGCGEDELRYASAVGSAYEFVLDHGSYISVFPVRKQQDREENAHKILLAFNDKLPQASFPQLVLTAFADGLKDLGLDAEEKSARLLATRSNNSDALISQEDLAAARHLQEQMSRAGRGAHPIWAAWLAAMLPHVALAGDGAAVARALLSLAKKAMAIQDSISDPVLDDDVLRMMNGQIDYCENFWFAIHGQEDIASELKCQEATYIAAIRPRMANQAQIDLAPAFQAGRDAIAKMLDPSMPQAEDPPLQLRYSPANNDERAIRGCILALQAGLPQADGTVAWGKGEWITTFNVKPATNDGFGARLVDCGGGVTLFLDTQGATRSDGLIEQVSSYAGTPLFTAPPAPPRDNEEKLPEMFERVSTAREVPPLAYSAYYRAVRGTMDNAGVILESELWMKPSMGGDTLPGLPRDASDIDTRHWGGDSHQYLSRQPPGLPTFGPSEDHGVAQETLSFRTHDGDDSDFRVAVLYGGAGYIDSKPEQQIKLYAPTASPGFVQRWLSADLMLLRPHRWPVVRTLTDDQVRALRESGSKIGDAKAGMNAIPHPAVVAVELRVRWLSEHHLPYGTPSSQQWELQHLSGTVWQRNLFSTIAVKRVPNTGPNACVCTPVAGGYLVTVPAGTRAVLEAVTIVAGDSVDGIFARFKKDALVHDPVLQRDRPYERHGTDYSSRRVVRHYIEALPDAPAAGEFNFREDAFEIASPSKVAQAQELAVRLTPVGQSHSARWVRGARLESKRWQWSGYPVTFPIGGDLKDWLSIYSGTTDTMPAVDNASFSTTLKPRHGSGSNWLLGALVMVPLKLATPRPATHMGMVITPIPRFEPLLTKSLKDKIKPTFVYARVKGVSPRKRLTPPVWQEAIPLPHTSILEAEAKRQVNPGNLIVLRDPLYDTSDTGAFGGIAERVELDVVSTWTEGLKEIGPNPIFHGSPWVRDPGGDPAKDKMEPQATLRLEMPFGLGYDRVVGGRPAQTGAVVRPVGAGGRWLLAKCRLRRLVVPDSILDSLLGGKEGSLDSRRVEDGWIPEDFAVYATAALSKIDVGSYGVKLPGGVVEPGQDERLIYLVTWHRDRWGEAEITWRPLVHVYLRGAKIEAWELKAHKAPFEQAAYPLSRGGEAEISYSLSHDALTYRVDASDYTDSRWLSFIGSFEQEQVTPADHFELKRVGEVYELSSTSPMPKLQKADSLCPSLLLVFNPQRDLMRGRIAQDGGELVGVYAATTVEAGPVRFDKAILRAEALAPEPGIRQRAIVMKLQRRNIAGPVEALPATWVDMVDAMLPREEQLQDSSLRTGRRSNEARMRLVPEYIGPINVV